ncbi:malate permease [Lachnospiraceae bacterium KM106-2]|nr:malate permease [Lachnospiraceae bacterium KM106-2]
MKNQILFSQMIQLFLMILFGFILFKVKLMSVELNQKLTKLLVDFTLPMLIVSSVLTQQGERELDKVGKVFLISIVLCLVLPVISYVVIKLLHFPKGQQGIYMFMFQYSNIGFMGFPILDALYGKQAVLYTAVLNMIVTLSVYTIGVAMMYAKGEDGTSVKEQIHLNQLLTPGVIGSCLAIVLYFTAIKLPKEITGAIQSVGNLTSPLAMLMIGATLANMKLHEILDDKRVYVFAVIKQIVFPLLCWPLFRQWISDSYMRGVLFILLLMPVANTAVLFATRYHADEKLAAKTIFVTTVLSILSIPLCFAVTGM